ncbi:MAG: FtsW/RodA/SpoVE family cell cycle protein [Porcipelethomonas sp.]
MFNNGLSYTGITMLSLLTHISMLAIVFAKGSYDSITAPMILSSVVLVSDIVYFFILKFLKQNTYTVDILMITILNMSLIFQSCLGKVGFDFKHFIFCVSALVFMQLGFMLTRNYDFIEKHKYIFYGIAGAIILCILLLTGSRGMWIDLGFITIQPSEFLKPVFVIICATSLAAQQNKKKILGIRVVYDNLMIAGLTGVILLLQWWCRDLGSLPTFMAVAACAFMMRICYPKAKLSKKLIIGICAAGVVALIVALKFAPAYVQDRLKVDIWSEQDGNGWQQCQALIAIAEGGWFGKGPGQGRLYKVPASDTDIIFSSISEDWGLLAALLAVFMLMLLLVTALINTPRSYYHTTLTVGVAAVFIAQTALNIFGSCNLIPFTGVTIPFISKGGSSMIACGFMAGLLKAGQSAVFPVPKKPVNHQQNRGTV